MIFGVVAARPSWRAGAICALALAGAPCAEAKAEESESTTLEEISVEGRGEVATRGYQPVATSTATGYAAPILDVPQSISVISQEVIRDQFVRSLDDALANASGVTQTNTLGGTQDAFIRRGFGENRDGSVLTDGLRTALPRSFNATTERVEVLKGPSSALYGILDPGGLINLVTKKPQETFGGSAEVWGSSFGGGAGEFDVTGPIDGANLSYRMIGSYQNTDYWKNFGKTEKWLAAPSLAWRGEDTTVTLSYLHEDYSTPFDRGTIFHDGKPIKIGRRTRLDERYNVTDGKTDLASIKVEHAFSEAWTLNAAYSFSHNTYSDNQARVLGFNAATGQVTRRADATQGSTFDVHSGRVDLAGDVAIAEVRHQMLFGASYDHSDTLRTDMYRCANDTGFDIDDPVYGTLPKCPDVSGPSLAESDQRERLKTWSVYAQDAIHLTDRLIAIGGARFQDYESFSGRGRDALFRAATDGKGAKFIPRLGGVFKLTPEISAYAMWSRSFRPQTSTTSPDPATNIASLPPEEGESYEGGLKFEAPSGLTATAAVYHIDKANVMYSRVDGAGNVTPDVHKGVRSRGFELDVAGQVTERVSLIASYAYTDAEIIAGDYKGERPVNVAKHTASFYAAYDFGKVWREDTFRAGGGVRVQGKRPGFHDLAKTDLDGDQSYDLPAYGVIDLFAAYRIAAAAPVSLQLTIKNLLDKTYYTSSIGTTRWANSIGEPFQAILSARVDF